MSAASPDDIYGETLAAFDRPFEPLTAPEVANALGCARRTAYKRLEKLAERGDLQTKKVGARGRVWWRPPGEETSGGGPTTGDEAATPSGDRYHALLDAIDQGFCVVEVLFDEHDAPVDYRFLEKNSAFVVQTGLEPPVGARMRELVPRHEERWFQAYGRVARTREPERFTSRAQYLDDRWYEVLAFPIDRPEDHRVGILFDDVTERRATEQALRSSEERLHLALESEDMAAWEYDYTSGAITYRSPAHDRLFGYDERPETWGMEQFLEHVHPDDRADVAAEVDADLGRGEGLRYECRVVRADGETRWLRVRGEVHPDDGEAGRMVGVVRDVTRRKRHERELERYTGLVDAVGEPVYELDARGRFTFVNEAAVEQSGYTADELLGEHVTIGMDDEAVVRAETALVDALAAGGECAFTLEYDVVTKGGERYPVENHVAVLTDDDGRFRGTAGVLRDISVRRERERQLQASERRYRALAEHVPNGAVALFDADLEFTLAAGQQLARHGLEPEDVVGTSVDDVIDGLDESRDVRRRCRAALHGESGEFEFAFDGRQYRAWVLPVTDDAGDPFAGMVMATDVTRPRERQAELERRREVLATLAQLNDVVHDLTDAVIDQSTRSDVEEAVCAALAGSDTYRFAWVAGVDPRTRRLVPRVEVGVDGYLSAIPLSVDLDDPDGGNPIGRAVVSHDTQVIRYEDTAPGRWQTLADQYGFRASASIPLVHEGTLYGLLGVYADRPDAFDDQELGVIARLGPLVGHAIAAVERKQALLSDTVVELEFQVAGLDGDHAALGALEGRLAMDSAVQVDDGVFLVYGTATGRAVEHLRRLMDAGAVPHWEALTVRETDGDASRYELKVRESPVLTSVTAHGGYVADAVFEDGDFYLRVHLAEEAGVGKVVEMVRETYPGARLATRQRRPRPERPPVASAGALFEDLTDRQRAALEAGYFSGFYEWPRESSGEDVADSLAISPSTFHQHLRKAEKKVLDAVFAGT